MRLGRERPRKGSLSAPFAPPAAGFNEAGARTPQKVGVNAPSRDTLAGLQ